MGEHAFSIIGKLIELITNGIRQTVADNLLTAMVNDEHSAGGIDESEGKREVELEISLHVIVLGVVAHHVTVFQSVITPIHIALTFQTIFPCLCHATILVDVVALSIGKMNIWQDVTR